MPRPGFVLDVDRSTPPIAVLARRGLPPREAARRPQPGRSTRPSRSTPLDDLDGAIRHALLDPLDSDPLPALLFPGMKLTIAFDDISLPLPPMRRPDIRQRVIEAVLDLAADAGVDDVAPHRRPRPAPPHDRGRAAPRRRRPRLRRLRAAAALLYNHDAEDPDNLAFLGTTDQGEEVEINKRAAESDLLVYVNINLVAMDGGWKSTATGLARTAASRHHHNVRHDAAQPRRSWTSTAASCTRRTGAWARCIARRRRQDLPDRDDAQHRHLPDAVRLPAEARVGVDGRGPGHVPRHDGRRSTRTPPRMAAQDLPVDRGAATDDLVQAGEVEAVHERHDRERATSSSS